MIIARIRMLFVVGLVGVLLSVFTSNAVFGATTCTFKINASRTKIGMSCRSSQANTIPFTQTLTKESSRLYSFTSNGCKMSVTTSSNTKGVHKTVDKLGLPGTVASCPGLPSSQGNITISQSSTEDPAGESQTDQENIDKCEEKGEVYNPDSENPDKCDPKCEDGQTLQDGKCTGDTTTKCAVEGVGWIVCPVIGFLTKLNDEAYDFIQSLLTVPAEIFDNAGGAKTAWEAFRNLANIAFVIAFMVIIYSQITGAGVSNYGIKKLLPKLVVTAILVNISFYVCAIAVDISNIVGSSIKSFLEGIPVGSDLASSGQEGIWNAVGGPIVATTVGIGTLLLIILAPASLLAFALVIFILIARQAFIILLIVVSPLAFVAYMLPNTQDWFTKWRKALTAMLLVFPIVGAVFGVSKLASDILLEVAQNSVDGEPTLKLVAASVLAIPLFAIPGLLKGAMAGAGTIGARLSGLQDKANSRMGRGIKNSRIGEATNAFKRRSELRRTNRRVGDGTFGKINRGIDRSRFGRYIGGDIGAASAAGVIREQEGKNVANVAGQLSKDAVPQTGYVSTGFAGTQPNGGNHGRVGYLQDQFNKSLENGDEVGAQAALYALKNQGEFGVNAIQQTLAHHSASGGALYDASGGSTSLGHTLQNAINTEHQDLKEKEVRITNWAGDGKAGSIQNTNYGGLTAKQIASQTESSLTHAQSTGALTAQNIADVQGGIASGSIEVKSSKRGFF